MPTSWKGNEIMKQLLTNEEIGQMLEEVRGAVKAGTSEAFVCLSRKAAITADSFLKELDWLCQMPAVDCDGRAYRAVGIRTDGSCARLSIEYRLDQFYNTYYLPYYCDIDTGSTDLRYAFIMRIDDIRQFRS